MWRMGAENWIRYGWGEEMSSTWTPDNKLHVDFSNHDPINPATTPSDAAILTVNDIINSYPAPYTLMCSGGVDSQLMIWAWRISQVPFKVVSVKYKSNGIWFNDYDLKELEELSNKTNLPIDYREFDIIDFLENGLSTVANDNDCDSPQICTHIKISEMVDSGTILFSGNIIQSKMSIINYTILGLHRYSLRASTATRKVIPFFLLHDPRFAFSFDQYSNLSNQKSKLYEIGGCPLICQPDKFNGFEKLKEYYDKYFMRVSIEDRKRFISKPSHRVFDLLFRHPYEGVGKCKKTSGQQQFF